MPCAILTYHAQIISADDYAGNDHRKLARDLELITDAGRRIVPLQQVVDHLLGRGQPDALDGTVSLTFDDGPLPDVADVAHPAFGPQRGFLNILRDFRERHGAAAQPGLHATSFVIASPEARRRMDERSLHGLGWMGHEWWAEAARDPLLAIESHGWDHNHPDAAPGEPGRGRFDTVDTEAACRQQVIAAGRYIAKVTGAGPPRLFAYPYGQSSDYLRQTFLPGLQGEHGLDAAVGTEPAPVTADSDRWNLPRFVAGRDWQTPEGLQALLEGLDNG